MSKYKVLNIVGHDLLEYNRLVLFNEIGFNILTTGVYTDPLNPDPSKPYLHHYSKGADPALLAEFSELNPVGYTYGSGNLRLTKEFINKFDIILASWIHEPLIQYKHLLKDKIVIYESLGQSDRAKEFILTRLRNEGVKVVRMSESERYFPNYAGADAIIDLEVDTDYYTGWSGKEEFIFTVNSAILRRKHVSNTDLYLEITKDLPKKLYGSHNKDVKASFCHNQPCTREELLEQYRLCRAFFSLGTAPCPVVLTFKEAMAVGCPVVTWGPVLGGTTFRAHTFIENGVSGFTSDNPEELKHFCKMLLNDYDLAKVISKNAREVAKKNFSKDVIKEKWKYFLIQLGLTL